MGMVGNLAVGLGMLTLESGLGLGLTEGVDEFGVVEHRGVSLRIAHRADAASGLGVDGNSTVAG